jgi:hypothetical protein
MGSKAIENIISGPGGYDQILRDIADRKAALSSDLSRLQAQINSYTNAIQTLADVRETTALTELVEDLQTALKSRQTEMSELTKDEISFQTARTLAMAGK